MKHAYEINRSALKEEELKFDDRNNKLTGYLQILHTLEKKGTSEETEIIVFGFANTLNEVLEIYYKTVPNAVFFVLVLFCKNFLF